MNAAQQNYRFQKIIVIIGSILFIVKLIAWYMTSSVAILTDALESTINVISGFVGLYSLYLSAQPQDTNHPYGHGKVEFLSAAVEGSLISIAGVIIMYESILKWQNPSPVHQLDIGLLLIGGTAAANFILGKLAIQQGEKSNSLALIASGKHLQTDTYSTFGIMFGLILLLLTDLQWIDSAVAMGFGLMIIYTGYKILRDSVAGIMDEADTTLLGELVDMLEKNRKENWIDLHNLRIIKYGSNLHIDCHVTLPWYFTVREAHDELEAFNDLVTARFGKEVELFIHTDGCLPLSCQICQKKGCNERVTPFSERITWTVKNSILDQKHSVKSS
ncbi:MAG: cation diffusion facilitator family transporter [Spirosomataceae bacterium]